MIGFPLVAMAVGFGVLVPAATWLSARWLQRRRERAAQWSHFGEDSVFVALVAPTAVPLVWVLSAALHQAETVCAATACMSDHGFAAICADAALLALALVGIGAVTFARSARASAYRPRGAIVPGATARLRALCDAHPGLRSLRVVAVRDLGEAAMTSNLWRPQVSVDACFAMSADDAVLEAALLHERAHVAKRDPLRDVLVRAALALNPARAWLQPDFERWRQAREAGCDGAAVYEGGDALALAQGLVSAARFRCAGAERCGGAVALGGEGGDSLRLRIALLLEGPDRPRVSRAHALLVAALLALVVTAHFGAGAPLDLLHHLVESAVAS